METTRLSVNKRRRSVTLAKVELPSECSLCKRKYRVKRTLTREETECILAMLESAGVEAGK